MSRMIAVLLLLAMPAMAHDAAHWIKEGQYRDEYGLLCCGPLECRPVADSEVERTPQGYRVQSFNQTVPFSRTYTTPSQHGGYWLCQRYSGTGKQISCFFARSPLTH